RERRLERGDDVLHRRRCHRGAHPRGRLSLGPPQRALRLADRTDMTARVVHADAILPGDETPLRDAALVIDDEGTVLDVGPAAEILPRHAGAPVELARGVLMPGLVNAHTHIELSALRGKVSGGHGFVPWVERMMGIRASEQPEDEAGAIE